MKRYTLALLITSSVALAGDPDSAKSAKSAKSPNKPIVTAPASDPWGWFVGGSGGYLVDNESGMITGHVGVDLPWTLAGMNQAVFLEVGWTECGDAFDIARKGNDQKNRRTRKGFNANTSVAVDTDLQIIPITLNYKLEYEIASHLKLYAGAGAGIAVVDVDASGSGFNGSDDDVVFFGQVFAGLLYELTDNLEIYGGVRGLYMDEPHLNVSGVSLGGNAMETDLLIEGGGRLNF